MLAYASASSSSHIGAGQVDAPSGSHQHITKAERVFTPIAFLTSSRTSVDTFGSDAQDAVSRSSGSSSQASPAMSTPRASSPSQSPPPHNRSLARKALERSTRETTESSASPTSSLSEDALSACMAGLALQVQSAVSRNVTGPLVQVLTDAEEAAALHLAQQAPHDGKTQVAKASRSSIYSTALSSPELSPSDLMDTDAVEAQLESVQTGNAESHDLDAAKLQGQEASSDGNGTEASAVQTDISRTPSTSTTGSSHAGSLDTAISSVQSGNEFEKNYKLHIEEQSADTLQINVGYDSSVPPSQASPVSIGSEADNELLQFNAPDGTDDPSLAEAKYTAAKVRRYAALLELIDTEHNYAYDLATLVLVFFDNLNMMPFFADQPARQALVMRNSEDLLRTHQKLSAKLDHILVDLGLRKPAQSRQAGDEMTELEKALSPQADEAIVRAAKVFNQMMPQLQSYKAFCSRHGEALALIREAEKRHADWDAYERHCAEILKQTSLAQKGASRPPSASSTPSVWGISSSSYFTPVVASASSPVLTSPSTSTLTTGTNSGPNSASVTPGAGPAPVRQNSSRLLFRDFLIKPIQRLCLYPLVLQTLQKHSSAIGDPVDELSLAISLMREVADQVDEAGKRRESELRADLISSRIEPNQGVTLSFLKSLGDCQLSGTLDVLHHHRVLNPLTAPLRFKYFGVFIYHSFLLMVKVRKNATYECRHWFPLWAARLSNVEEERNLIPNSFRLSVKDHHFELAASNAKEKQLWIDMLSLAISRAAFSPPGSEAAFPCSLFFGETEDSEAFEASEAPTPNATRPAEFQGYFETPKTGTVDPLMEFLAMHAAGAAQTTSSNQKGQPSSDGPWMPTEILLRHASPNSRAIVDRGMVLSDSVITARISRDGGALSTLYAASGSGIGSAVGSSLGLNRLSAKETSAVKIQRRKSCAGLLENADAMEDPNNVVFTATFVQPSSRSRASTRSQFDTMNHGDGWKSTLRKKANRVRPASIFAPVGLTVNAEGLASPTWGPASVSTPSSPTPATRESLVHEFGVTMPLSPTFRPTQGGTEPSANSLTSSPISGSASAGNSTVNLRPHGLMPARSRTSLYGMKDSLTTAFAKRGRTRSVVALSGDVDVVADFGSSSVHSSAAASPLASDSSLPYGELGHSNSRRTSDEDIHTRQQQQQQQQQQQKGRIGGRLRTNSITSVTGSIRRVFTNSSFTSLSHKRPQNDAARGMGGSVQAERQLAMASSLPTPLTEFAPAVGEQHAADRSASPRKGTLRRSRTMLDYSKNWFRAAAATSVVERVNAEAVGSNMDSQLRRQPSSVSVSPMTEDVDQGVNKTAPQPLRTGSAPVTSQTPKFSEGFRRASDTNLSAISEGGSRQSSRTFNPLRFLQNNRLSPMPSKTGLNTRVSQ